MASSSAVRSRMRLARPRLATLALAALVLAGLAMRLHGSRFGLPAMNDPDELMFELGALRMMSKHTLNPAWFGHPATTTIYLLVLVNLGVFVSTIASGSFISAKAFTASLWLNPGLMIWPGRVAMVLFGTWAIWLTWRLARRLTDPRGALLASALVAFSPLLVTWSQVVRSDMMATCFMLLALLAITNRLQVRRRRDLVLAAFWLACATATKWPVALAGTSLVMVITVQALRQNDGAIRRALRIALPKLALSGALYFAFLILISPYLVLDFQTVVADLHGEAQSHHLGATGGSPAFNLAWYVRHAMLPGLGWGGILLLLLALCLGLRRHLVGRGRGARVSDLTLVVLPFLVCFLAVMAMQNLVWARWLIPLVPLLAILAGRGFSALLDVPYLHASRSRRRVLGTLTVLALLLPLALTNLGNATMRLHDTRQQASAWAIGHVPAGRSVLVEQFAFDLLAQPWTLYFPVGRGGCLDARGLLEGKVDYATIDNARGGHSNLDYGTLPEERRADCRADFAIITEYERYRAERQAFPREYAAYRQLLQKGRIVAQFRPRPGQVGGPHVYVVQMPR
ncbi:glycosyltransferase family 39 protein [Novosphingobium profundi]|uniref:ArnT family glycosyltransferase n=1 Tax=Novosphingobium profundi TaxID=1774954 RepID=UPI001BDAF569|nr:glycosyltransferase family 39 protein [Novosphingobium profundi]MBT0668680.1 glycosyltransferase family 39 protein [Novosphingobium profundi]